MCVLQFNADGSDIHGYAGYIRSVCHSCCAHWQQLHQTGADADEATAPATPSKANASKGGATKRTSGKGTASKGTASKGGPSSRACLVCHSTEREDRILLCDRCDAHYHVDCIGYPGVSERVSE